MSFSWYVSIGFTARSHVSVVNATLPSLDCITAFEIALDISLICEGCIDAYLIVLSVRVLCCSISSHDINIWRNRTSARTHIFRLSGGTYSFTIQPAHTFPLKMRLCPALIVLQQSKSHLKDDCFVKAVSVLTCAIASRAVLLDLIKCHEYFAQSDIWSDSFLTSFSLYVLTFFTARSHFSVVDASWPSLDCITPFRNGI